MRSAEASGGGLGIGLAVALVVGVSEGIGPGVPVAEVVGVTLPDGVGDGATSGVGAAVLFCGSGSGRTAKSARLSSVSWPDPAAPPGRRSTLAPAGDADAAVPSSHALAVPQPTASTAVTAP